MAVRSEISTLSEPRGSWRVCECRGAINHAPGRAAACAWGCLVAAVDFRAGAG
jgi:hypothetical protein